MLRNWKRIVMVLLGAALFAGSVPLAAYADRDEKRNRDRRVERKSERKQDYRESRHHDRDRDRVRHRDRDDNRRRYDRDACGPRHVVYHRDRVVYAPRRPVYSGLSWSIYATNLPQNDCDYWDPYCERGYVSLNAYRSHLRHAHHPHEIHVLDDGYPVCGYRNNGGDSWVRVTLAGGIRF